MCIAGHPTIVRKPVVLDLCTCCDCSCAVVSKASDCTQRDLPLGGVAGFCVYGPQVFPDYVWRSYKRVLRAGILDFYVETSNVEAP